MRYRGIIILIRYIKASEVGKEIRREGSNNNTNTKEP
jgi:hypothetical protein